MHRLSATWFLCASGLLAGCGDEATRCPADGPGLVVDVDYLGGADGDCFFIADPNNITVTLGSGTVQLDRNDAASYTRDEVVFPWPAGLADGSEVRLGFYGNRQWPDGREGRAGV